MHPPPSSGYISKYQLKSLHRAHPTHSLTSSDDSNIAPEVCQGAVRLTAKDPTVDLPRSWMQERIAVAEDLDDVTNVGITCQ